MLKIQNNALWIVLCFLVGCGTVGTQTTGDAGVDFDVTYLETLNELVLLRDTGQLSEDQINRMKAAVLQSKEARDMLKTITDPALRKQPTALLLQALLLLQGITQEIKP